MTAPVAPGPRGVPLLGNAPDLQRNMYGAMARDFRRYGDVVRYRLGPRVVHLLSHPDLAQQVLVKGAAQHPKIPSGDGLGLLLGRGLVTNDDHPSWLRQRRMMQPVFHRQGLAGLAGEMTAAGDRMLERWRVRYRPGDAVDVAGEMMRVTLDIISRTMFSVAVDEEAARIGTAVEEGTQFVSQRSRRALRLPLHWPLPGHAGFRAAKGTIDAHIAGIIRERRAAGPGRGDLLDLLMAAQDADTGERMTDRQLHDEVLTVIGAGHETTANALSWAWFLLAQHPQVLARLQAEVDGVLEDRDPTLADLGRLPYTAGVFQETLRLYPSAPMVSPRLVLEATILGGYAIPARSALLVSISNIHRHPDFWADPGTFDPGRWVPGGPAQEAQAQEVQKRHRLAFMPFGAGPRLCIGNNFALMEGPLLLAQMARAAEFRLLPGHSVQPEMAVTLRPRGGLPMTFWPRRGRA
ncbi:pentalenene oxygenase [Deinococcus carri]|uniref:Pentalenene oxygenase n=1 Tax=Deinococcus carri TaxID=1211323 RepID=A0ABP9W9P5_9DEIO